MTDQITRSSEQGADLDAALDLLEKKVQAGESREPTSRSDLKIGAGLLIATLVSFVAIGMAAYGVFQFYQLDEKMHELVTAVAKAEQPVRNIETNLNSLAAEVALQSTRASNLEEKLTTALAEIRASAGTSSQDWILAEVEYLLRLANQRVMMEKEVRGAIALLQAADTIIDQAENVSAFPVRQAIAEDIASLKSLQHLDIEGTYLKLAALTHQVKDLNRQQLAFASNQVVEEVTEAAEPDEDSSWDQDLLQASMMIGDRLYSLVDYRQGTERVQPILPPKEEYYLRQNLIFKFEHAQLALLRGKQTAYDQSVADSIEWVETYFDQQDSVTEAMVATLKEISNAKVEQAIPGISGSLTVIRAYLSEFHLAPEKNSQQQQE